jgi:prepilin-type N-terminal cleavage/methylation domain-containing protein
MTALDRHRGRTRRTARRAFTLVELLIALVAGLLVAMAAFVLSKNASNFFQREARIASTQLAVTLGMNRLAADLQRAAFMSSPNVQKDPWRCGNVVGWPSGLSDLSGVQIVNGGSATAHPADLNPQSNDNALTPDSLIIGGAFNTTEQFPVRTIVTGVSGGFDVYLQMDTGAMVRTQNAATDNGTAIADIFRLGRFLRIVDADGRHEYGVIQAVGQQSGAWVITVATTPAIPVKSPTQPCGINKGFNVGVLANPVSRIKYDLRSLAADANYGPLVAAPASTPAAISGDNHRTELIRVELDQNGAEVASTLELVAEYAVDLKFGIATLAKQPVTGDYKNTDTARYAVGSNANVYTIAGAPSAAGSTPERIRSVQVRLATRTRAPDRAVDLPFASNPDARRARFVINDVLGSNKYFRMRTIYNDIALPNQSAANAW